jgi:hypothetical protein
MEAAPRAVAFLGPLGGPARLLGALDLGDAPVVDDELHDSVAEVPHLGAHEGEPLGLASARAGIAGFGGHGRWRA